MTVRLWIVQATLPMKSSIPEDASQNSWHFRTDGALSIAATASELCDEVDTFYSAIGSLLGQQCSGAVAHKVFERDPDFDTTDAATYAAGPWGPPVFEVTYSGVFTPGTGVALPAEVCVAMSFKGVNYSSFAEFSDFTRPRARHRGRVFLGPLDPDGLAQDATTKEMTVSSAARTTIATAATALIADTDSKWSVHSHVERAFSTVDSGWIDNEPDTIRRRSRRTTVRTTF